MQDFLLFLAFHRIISPIDMIMLAHTHSLKGDWTSNVQVYGQSHKILASSCCDVHVQSNQSRSVTFIHTFVCRVFHVLSLIPVSSSSLDVRIILLSICFISLTLTIDHRNSSRNEGHNSGVVSVIKHFSQVVSLINQLVNNLWF
jgi:hypothetical protein